MSELLDKLGAAVHRTADTVTTELEILSHEQKLREYYQTLGKLYYQREMGIQQPEGTALETAMDGVTRELERITQLRNHKNVAD